MALTTANGVTVIEGTIVRPLFGIGTMDLKLDQPGTTPTGFDPGTQVTVVSENGYSVVGVVDPNRGGSFLDSVHVRILCGGGGMSKLAIPRSFGGGFVRDVVNWLLQNAGETVSSTADQGLLGTSISSWAVMGHTVGWNLRALLRFVAPTMNFRILSNGTVWIGNETWPSASGTFDAIDQDPADGSYVLGVEAPFVVPGTNIDGLGNINRCVDLIVGGKMRTHVYVDFPSEGARGINASIARQVAQATAGVDYYANYVFEVVSQSSDLTTVDVQPSSARAKDLLEGMQRVPVRSGSGMRIQLNPGATVLLGWDGGDPRTPYVFASLGADPAQWTLNGDLSLLRLLSAQAGTPALPPTCADNRIQIDPSSTDESGWFTITGYSASPPADKSLGQTIQYQRPYPNGSRVGIVPADDTSAGLFAFVVNSGGGDGGLSIIYCSASDKNGFTIQNRFSPAATTGPALAGKWHYRSVGY